MLGSGSARIDGRSNLKKTLCIEVKELEERKEVKTRPKRAGRDGSESMGAILGILVKKKEQRSEGNLGESIEEWAEKLIILEIVFAPFSEIQHSYTIRYTHGNELSPLQCCKSLRAIAAC